MMTKARGPTENNDNGNTSGRKPGFLKVLQSVLAGAIGVQSHKNREEDFESGSPLPYIVAGIVFVIIFVGTVGLVVRWVISAHSG